MSELQVTDARLEAELRNARNGVTLKGADGRILGIYTPIDSDSMQPRITEEEIQRRIKAGGGRKLADILRDLDARP